MKTTMSFLLYRHSSILGFAAKYSWVILINCSLLRLARIWHILATRWVVRFWPSIKEFTSQVTLLIEGLGEYVKRLGSVGPGSELDRNLELDVADTEDVEDIASLFI